MLHITKNNLNINDFSNILAKIKGIYIIPFKTFLVPNARVISSIQIDFNDDQSCQITKYIDVQNKPQLLINHTDTLHTDAIPSSYIMYTILLHEICLKPNGVFAKEFLNNPTIPENSRAYNEIYKRFKKPIETLLPLAAVQRMTFNPPDEEKKDITLNLIFRQELSALCLTPEEKKPYISQPSSMPNNNKRSDNNDVSPIYSYLEQIPH